MEPKRHFEGSRRPNLRPTPYLGVSLRNERRPNVCGRPKAQASQLPRCESEPAHRCSLATVFERKRLPGPARSISLPTRPRGKERRVLEDNGHANDRPAEPAEPQGYGALGDRVTGILEAAEQAAGEIRAEARKLAADLQREARAESERLKEELTADARRLRQEADEYARDMRLAVEAYATQHRRQAEEEGRAIVAQAEKQSTTRREAAEQLTRKVEADVRRREDALRGEVRLL